MKTLYLTITLFIFLTLAVLPNSFAQGTLAQPSVRLVYFLPNDRPARPDRIEALRQLIKDTQQFFADEMERHGFGRKTFAIEIDEDGEPLVHRVDGRFDDAYYHQRTPEKVWEELNDTPEHIDFIAIDISIENLDNDRACGVAKGYYEQNGTSCIIPASGHCFNVPLAAHELGHTFALEHDFRDDAYIMSYGRNRSQLSKCAAEWLDAHVFFNNALAQFNRDTAIQILAPTDAPNGIRLRFDVADPDGLHQAMLCLTTTSAEVAWDPNAKGFKLEGCHLLDTESDTIEFVTSELIEPSQDQVRLQVIDKRGGIVRQTFPISFAHLLPPPKYVSIPDQNLATAVREALGLGRDARIPERAIQYLTELDARKSEIKDLMGLEHAVRLRRLELRENQILDISPLANLKNLESLGLDQNKVRDITPLMNMTQLTWLLIGGNPISDFTPLANLTRLEGLAIWNSTLSDMTPLENMTQLKNLWLDRNKIDDITPLSKMTKLEELWLRDNQIRNVSPLTDLTNLQELHLQGNPIKDREPLIAMLRRNPDIKIYLKAGGNPLPVSLSHFRAERTDAGVILKWITESELNNAGFYIYRSETKDGEFKIVNPKLIQGAGTTSERHTYTWKDTTAKPNVVYYYRIEDISHAGVRKQLATVRMRGYVSAAGKLTTKWGDLKLQE